MADVVRLAVGGAAAVRASLAAGLRDVRVVSFDAGGRPPLDACDAVLFLEPQADEAALVQRCLEAGKHVLLTPRPWLSLDVLEGLVAAAGPAGARFAVLNADRFLPSRQLIRQQLDTGRLGQPGLLRLHRWRAPVPEHADEIEIEIEIEDESGALPLPLPLPLMQDLDLTLWLMGTAPTLVYALERGAGSAGDVPGPVGLTQLHLGFPGGGMAVIDNADLLPPGDGYQSLSVIGASGATYADDHQNVQLVFRGGHPSAVLTDESGSQLLALAQSFLLALNAGDDAGDDLRASVASWRTVVAVAHAARRSIDRHQAVPLEIMRPLETVGAPDTLEIE